MMISSCIQIMGITVLTPYARTQQMTVRCAFWQKLKILLALSQDYQVFLFSMHYTYSIGNGARWAMWRLVFCHNPTFLDIKCYLNQAITLLMGGDHGNLDCLDPQAWTHNAVSLWANRKLSMIWGNCCQCR